MKFHFAIIASATGLAVSADAAIQIATNNEVGPGGIGSTFTPSYAVSSTDLINGLLPTAFGGDFGALEISGGLPVLTNGTYGTITEPGGAPDRTHLIFGLAGGGNGTGTFATYSLNLAASPAGYDIDRFDIYAGWNDSGRDQQLLTIAYSRVGSSTFIDLPLIDFNPTVGANLQSANRVMLFETGPAVLASGVDEIRFTFSPSTENGYSGYAELDVIGRATVPEPGSLALLAGAMTVLGLRRRRA